ncbi:MAG: hypothetical protein ACC645_16370 [Pirellulales bacterium]
MDSATGLRTYPQTTLEVSRGQVRSPNGGGLGRALRYLYFSRFSKPKAERTLYRHIRRHRATHIVELGLGSVTRSKRMLEMAARYAGSGPVHYTIIDLFDDRPAAWQQRPLIDVYRQLRPSEARLRLVPGNAHAGLAHVANELLETDLLLISADQDETALAAAWFYVPRMLHADSLVLREVSSRDGESSFQPVRAFEIAQFARQTLRRRAA